MASKMPRWLVGCGIGCAALLALAIGGAGVGAVYVGKLFDEVDSAVAVRTELEERFDAPQTFTPAADGAIGADRMERFLRVQRTLQPFCVRFDETVGRIDRIDARGSEAPPSLGEVLGVIGGALGFVPLITEYIGARNQGLLDAEMGLGEYTYIYLLAYASGPGDADTRDRLRKAYRGSARRAYLGMLDRQRALLAGEAEAAAELALLDAEIERLREEPRRRPWEDGLPEAIAASLEPSREELRRLECPGAAEMALDRVEHKGWTVQAN